MTRAAYTASPMSKRLAHLPAPQRLASVAGGAAATLLIAGCGSPAAPASPTHLASIQSAVTCPAVPPHNAVASPLRKFTTKPAVVIQRNVGYCAYIATTRGVISVRLRPEFAPNAVNNFVFLAKHGFYDGLTFDQRCPAATGPVCPTGASAVLAGDPTASGSGGPGYTVPSDPVVGNYLFGAVAMYGANAATIGSQFLISTGDSSGLARRYDIFGQVTDGLPALVKLASKDRILWVAVVPTAPEP
jgi:cyclophilin family peptidyl-prolyl cis-trans isomerase